MSYEDQYLKYQKYQKLYEDLKDRLGVSSDGNPGENLKGKVQNFLQSHHINYDSLINRLRNHCNERFSGVNQVKDKLKDLYNNIDNQRLKQSNLDIDNVLAYIKSGRNDANINWERYHQKICAYLTNKIIPELEKERNLQQKFIENFRNLPQDVKNNVNVDKYIQFARNNGLLNDSVENIVAKYSNKINQFTNYIKNEANSNQYVQNFLKGIQQTTPNTTMMAVPRAAAGIAATTAALTGQLSKHGHKCTSECKKGHHFLLGDYLYCDTAEYDTLIGKRNWDYCPESNK